MSTFCCEAVTPTLRLQRACHIYINLALSVSYSEMTDASTSNAAAAAAAAAGIEWDRNAPERRSGSFST